LEVNSLEKVGERIRLLRKKSNLSQLSLAERAGISYKYLGEIERGQVNLSVEIFLKIALALHVGAAELVNIANAEAPNLSKAKFILSELPDKELALEMLQSLQKYAAE